LSTTIADIHKNRKVVDKPDWKSQLGQIAAPRDIWLRVEFPSYFKKPSLKILRAANQF